MTKEQLDIVVGAVAKRHGVSFDRIFCKRRTYKIIAARFEAYYYARIASGWSYPKLGEYFGRHHTSVLWGVQIYQRSKGKSDEQNSIEAAEPRGHSASSEPYAPNDC